MSIEAMKQALEALDGTEALLSSMDVTHLHVYGEVDKAITTLRTAIEQAEKQEPVAWMTHTNDLMPLFHKTRKQALNWQTQPTPLYTTPPAAPVQKGN